jgi:hypothetical protein
MFRMAMDWTEIREIAEMQLEVDCGGEVVVEIATENLEFSEWRRAALELIEEQIVGIGTQFAHKLSYARTNFTKLNALNLLIAGVESEVLRGQILRSLEDRMKMVH